MCLVRDYYYERKNCDQKQVNPGHDPTLTRHLNVEMLAPLSRVTARFLKHRPDRWFLSSEVTSELSYIFTVQKSPIRLREKDDKRGCFVRGAIRSTVLYLFRLQIQARLDLFLGK